MTTGRLIISKISDRLTSFINLNYEKLKNAEEIPPLVKGEY